MLGLRGPAPNLDPGPFLGPQNPKPRTPKPRTPNPEPQTQNPKPRTQNPKHQNPKFSGPKKEVISILKNAWFKGSGSKSGPWAFFGVPKLSKKQLCLAKVAKRELLKQAVTP